jgi:hemolysin activation/secretion protein
MKIPPQRRVAGRRRSRSAAGLVAGLAAVALAAEPASAQPAPDAGRLLEQTRPAPAAPPPGAVPERLVQPPVRPTIALPEGVSVQVAAFRVSGAVSFDERVLLDLLRPWVGKRLDLRGLNEAAGALTRHYQNAGHFLSYAYLPAQRVDGGTVEIAVLEGRLESVQTVTGPEVRLREEVVQAHTDPLTRRQPVLQADAERALLLLNDLPGVTARAAVTPGQAQGGAELVVTVLEDEPLEVRLELDNHGSKSSGTYRASAALQLRDAFGWGDLVTARALVARQGGLVSGHLGMVLPIGGDGLRFGASLSRLQYQLGGSFARLGSVGTADAIQLRAQHPFVRTLEANLRLSVEVEEKRLRDEVILASADPSLGADRLRRSRSLGLNAQADWRDRWLGSPAGAQAGLAATVGTLQALNAGAAGSLAAPSWSKLQWSLARQQWLLPNWSLNLRAQGQLSGGALDSSEKLGLAGPYAVRAYAPGEAVVDVGWIGSLELRWSQAFLGGQFSTGLFHERASGRTSLLASGSANEPDLAGTGLSLGYSRGDLALAASLAWRGARLPVAEGGDPRPRLYFTVTLLP